MNFKFKMTEGYNRNRTKEDFRKMFEEYYSETEERLAFCATDSKQVLRLSEDKERRRMKLINLIFTDENFAKAYDWGLIKLDD